MKYVDKVLRKSSYEELRELFVNTQQPSKEISESYGCFINLSNTVGNIDDYDVLHIGDGSWCRTGLMFSFYSKSNNISVDPDCNKGGKLPSFLQKWNVRNFSYFTSRYEELDTSIITKPLIITLVHSHVNAQEVIEKFPNWEFIYINPCCKRSTQTFSDKFLKENPYIELLNHTFDENILTKMNEVLIFKNNKQLLIKKEQQEIERLKLKMSSLESFNMSNQHPDYMKRFIVKN